MRLAILIVGLQNSGKTSTIRHLVNTYCDKHLIVMRAGWQYLFLNPLFKALILNAYCVPASPTETGIDLSDRFKDWDIIPQVLIVAEQPGTGKYLNTIAYLNANGYTILQYDILDTHGSLDWERFNASNEILKLDNRANQIVGDIKNFLRTNGIV